MAEDTETTKKTGRPRKAGVVPAPNVAEAPVVEAAEQHVAPSVPALAETPAQMIENIEAVTSPATELEPIPGPAAASEPISEGLTYMATVASPTDTADKTQALFGDVSARMKTAFEKSTKLGEELVEFTKGNVEAVLASARVAAKAGETLGQEAADYGKKSFENATAAFKSFATVKSPTELFTLQSEFAKSSFDSAVAEASKISEAWLKFAGDIAQPLSTRYALAAEKFKSAAL